MKKLLVCLGLVLVLVQPVLAFRPVGWVYANWPWAYDSTSGDWFWFNTPDTQWVNGFPPADGWRTMPVSGLASGWSFYQWPFAYAKSNSAWNYINEVDTQWVVNMRTGAWSRFGAATELTGNYLVVDLSAGPSAANYPISALAAVPPGGWPEAYKTTKMVFRWIPAGTFLMGSPSGELGHTSDEIQHQVALTPVYYVGVFEVTQKQWERVMGTWPSYFNNVIYRDSRPVEQVSYNAIRGSSAGTGWPANSNVDANSFMGRLRARTGQTFDLPTESQWEYAGRAGMTTALNSGYNLTNTESDVRMSAVGRYWYNGGSGYSANNDPTEGTAKVGGYQVNQWGLYDIHGNVLEWCLDWFGSYPEAVSNPRGASSGLSRVCRGGGYAYFANGCRVGLRSIHVPDYAGYDIGFRVVLSPTP